MKRFKLQGFTLLELFITIAVVGVLAAIAFPAYQNYTRRAYYSEVVQATVPYKAGVTECFQHLKSLKRCNAGVHHVPAAISKTHGAIATLQVVAGIITVTPVAQHGILITDTYVLTPTVVHHTLQWESSGGGVANAYAD